MAGDDMKTPLKTVAGQTATIIVVMLLLIISGLCTESSRFNFDYTGGEKPWMNHVPSEINTTFEDALREYPYLRRFVCKGDSTDSDKNPFNRVPPICLEGRGAKMVVLMSYPTRSHLVFVSPQEGGLLEQKHMTEREPSHYYDRSGFKTKYFLIPFDDYEIPTFHPIESQIYLPLWKRAFQSANDMSDEYFAEHIRVMNATVKEIEFEGIQERHFRVACTGETRLHEVLDSAALADSLHTLAAGLTHENRSRRGGIGKIELIDSIASKGEVMRAVSKASPLLRFDINRHLRLDLRGQLTLRLFGTIDESANRCLRATIGLKDASVSDLQETACWIQ
jgi:hypothetical protein